jgi:glycosyltransferase involved in cell wall biosynthesis
MHESINYSKPIISYFKGWLWKLIRNTVCRRADLIMSISESMSTYIGQHCDTRIESVPTGADERLNVRDIDPTEVYNSYNISPGSQIVIYIGSMAKIRKLEFLLKSFKEVQNKKDVQLIMLGGREYQNRNLLKSYAKELGVFENIQFTGWLSENKLINKFIKTADIGVSPIPPNITCFRTSSPIKTHEYLNLETPVVASTVPDQQHVIEQSNGGYIVPFETTAFADKIIKLLDSPHMIKRFGKNGAKYVKQNRSYDSIATKISNIYHKI